MGHLHLGYLLVQAVAEFLVCRDVVDGLEQYFELFLEELDAVVRYLLLHVLVKHRVQNGLIFGQLFSKVLTILLSHLL